MSNRGVYSQVLDSCEKSDGLWAMVFWLGCTLGFQSRSPRLRVYEET